MAMYESNRYASLRSRFPISEELELLVGAVLAGNARASLWESDENWALLWDRCNNVLYLGGDVPPVEQSEFNRLVLEQIGSTCRATRRTYIRGRGLTEGSTEVLAGAITLLNPVRDRRRFYRFPVSGKVSAASHSVAGLEALPVSRALIEEIRPEGVDEVVEEIEQMWPSLEAFYQNGLGQVAILDGALVGFCTTEYMSADRCGIGVATAPELRRLGVATQIASNLIRQCLERGITPYWDCTTRNQPSVALAERLGFELASQHDWICWSF